ncbi:MAG: site-specific integrase, partial [Bacteroidota bacterium]|nr:site-specific integrase [Bacteroidota bacterium]
LDNLQSQVYEAHKSLTEARVLITADLIKNKLLGKSEKSRTLITVFKDHNKKVAALVGNEYAAGTLTRYETSLRHTQNFMAWKYQVSDINVKAVDHDFISNYEFYLRSEKKCANNSAVKYIKNFKKIVRICLASGWLEKDPFVNYKAKVKPVDRIFLTAEQIRQITEKTFDTDRLNQVRDIFLFCCYTGLAYADVQKLKPSEIVKGADGEMWIVTKRLKTDTATKVPLLPAALTILEKYSNDPVCTIKGKALPVSTNQKMNAYLKEIAGVCGINKDITFHTARHTFATTVTLSNGVPIETVSKMLGHTNIKTTQHYAKILDVKVSRDMALLKEKYKAGAF